MINTFSLNSVVVLLYLNRFNNTSFKMKHSNAKYQPINNAGNDFDHDQGYDKYDGNPLGDDTFRRSAPMSLFHYCCMCLCLPCIPYFGRTVEQGTRLEHHDLSGKLTVLNPGFHVRTPFVESFGQTIQMRDSTVCSILNSCSCC